MTPAANYPYCATRFAAMAHRGGPGWEVNRGRENTLAAFRAAVSLGYRYIETDVQATRDHELVCFHDPTLERMTGLPGRVRDYTAAELSSARVGGGEPIPLFAEVVEALPDTCFNVDLKTAGSVEPLVRVIREHHLANRILVDSFSPGRLGRFRAMSSRSVPTAMTPIAAAVTALTPFARANSPQGVALQVPVRVPIGRRTLPILTQATIDRVHRIGKVIHVWTINDAAEMARLIDLGVDGIITDHPDLLKNVLIDHDLWENT
ncbi:MAG: glycerophosphodiester phosphodiesterase [Propionibacteriaceae bacterium]|nr:glycerophosphodiester phosphodiesterase [Propionibacteriaceae bacterium]